MKIKLLLFGILLLCSCTNGNQLDAIFPSYYLNGDASKVWVQIGEKGENANDITPLKANRKSLIFFSNQTYRSQLFIHLGSDYGTKGTYYTRISDLGETVIDLYSGHKKKSYIINEITNNNLILEDVKTKKIILFSTLPPPLKNRK